MQKRVWKLVGHVLLLEFLRYILLFIPIYSSTIPIFNNLQYKFSMFNVHQILIAASLPIIYGIFGLILFTKYTSQSALSTSNQTYSQKMVGIRLWIYFMLARNFPLARVLGQQFVGRQHAGCWPGQQLYNILLAAKNLFWGQHNKKWAWPNKLSIFSQHAGLLTIFSQHFGPTCCRPTGIFAA